MGKILDQQLDTPQREYRNESETEFTMKLTGMVELLRKGMVFRATRNDMKRFFMLAEKMRWDKTLDRADATAVLFSRGINAKKKKITLRNDLLNLKLNLLLLIFLVQAHHLGSWPQHKRDKDYL